MQIILTDDRLKKCITENKANEIMTLVSEKRFKWGCYVTISYSKLDDIWFLSEIWGPQGVSIDHRRLNKYLPPYQKEYMIIMQKEDMDMIIDELRKEIR